MFYLENKTTFSGSDIKVYAYRSVNDFKDFSDSNERKTKRKDTDPLFPDDPFVDMSSEQIKIKLEEGLQAMGTERAKVTPLTKVTYPDGESHNSEDSNLQNIIRANAQPVAEELPREYSVTYPNGNTMVTENEAEAWETLNDILEENPEHGVEDIDVLELQSRVTNPDGTIEYLPKDEADQKLSDWKPLKTEAIAPDINYDKVQTNKVNPNYIDILTLGGNKNALNAGRKFQLDRQNAKRNEVLDSSGKIIRTKPIIELGSLYSITYSSFREKNAIRTLGRTSAKGYTRGQRTIAGSMNFAVFQSHELMDFLKNTKDDKGNVVRNDDIVLLDQLPKFNLMMIMINEYGGASILHMFGVTISTESQQTSAEDLALMNNVTFYAEDIMTIENVGNIWETSLSMLHPTVIAGRTLQFYNKNAITTFGSLMKMNSGSDGKINSLINRSRGLF